VDLNERVAVLEAQRVSDQAMLASINAKLDALHQDMTKYKGFLGGIAFVGSCVGVFLGFMKEWVLSHIR
jgi:hypothetical protein